MNPQLGVQQIGRAILGALMMLSAIATSAGGKPADDASRAIQEAYEREKALADSWEAKLQVEPRAFGVVAGVAVALIDVNGEPVIVAEGFPLGSRTRVTKIDSGRGELTLRRGDDAPTLHGVTNPLRIDFPDISQEALLVPAALALADSHRSMQSFRAWRGFSREEKHQHLLELLRDGMLVHYRVAESSSTSRRLMSEVISARRNAAREKFLAALRLAAPPEVKAQARTNEQSEDLRRKFLASLTDEQRELYQASIR
jgi:hypothetical protein